MIRALLIALAASAACAVFPTPAHAWWDDAWTSRTRVVLDTTDKGLALPSAQADVVLPVRLHSGNFDFGAVGPTGADLRVIGADDKTPLAFEVERFDPINELALLWVRVPTLAQGSDQNVLHVYAGNDKAPAPPAGALFAASHAVALHFREADGPAQDAAGGPPSTGPAVREANGLLGGALRLSGSPLAFGAHPKLSFTPAGGLTVALWLKPDAPAETSTLLTLGPVKLLRTLDQVEARVGDEKLGGAALPGSAWSHVALTVSGGRAQLYINGAPVAQADALLPTATNPALVIGEGYKGLVDELQVLPTARDAGWVKLAAAAQGLDASFARSQKESGDGAGEEGGHGGYMGILLANLTLDAWVVIGILMVMFVIAAAVMVTKARLVSQVGSANDRFLDRFRADLSGKGLAGEQAELAHSPLYRLYTTGEAEIAKRRAQGVQTLSGASLDAIKATLDAVQVRENHTLNARMVLLTIAISGGPFLGLLGTVVGVMITFAAIAAAGDVNVNAIAPGIAAALLATVAGLGVAIPALFGYNWLASRIKAISADMQIFVDEFVTRAAELHGQR
jgi:biopolymer transport protein ExbB